MIDYTTDAHTLGEMLLQLPEGTRVTCNAVRNLRVLDNEGATIGYIEVRGWGPEFEEREKGDE